MPTVLDVIAEVTHSSAHRVRGGKGRRDPGGAGEPYAVVGLWCTLCLKTAATTSFQTLVSCRNIVLEKPNLYFSWNWKRGIPREISPFLNDGKEFNFYL